jgi:hypothetical protein
MLIEGDDIGGGGVLRRLLPEAGIDKPRYCSAVVTRSSMTGL